jgi:hypothetical protein
MGWAMANQGTPATRLMIDTCEGSTLGSMSRSHFGHPAQSLNGNGRYLGR